jgi:hypothetical protein
MEDGEHIPITDPSNGEQSGLHPGPETQKVPETRRTVEDIISFGEDVLAGRHTGLISRYENVTVSQGASGGTLDKDEAVILDTKRDDYSSEEQAAIVAWIESKLGATLSKARISRICRHLDGSMGFRVFAEKFGAPDDPFHIVELFDINEAGKPEHPMYAFWSPSMIEDQEESGWEQLTDPQ